MRRIIEAISAMSRMYYRPIIEMSGGSAIFIPRKHTHQTYASQRRRSKRGRR